MLFFLTALGFIGFVSLGMMVFLTDPQRLGTLEFGLFYGSFFITTVSLFTVLFFLSQRHFGLQKVDVVRRGALLGAVATFVLFLQSVGALNTVNAGALAFVAFAVEWLFYFRRRRA